MSNPYVVTRVQTTTIDLDAYDVGDDENPEVVALEIALDTDIWDDEHVDACRAISFDEVQTHLRLVR